MNIISLTSFFKNLSIVVGLTYVLSVFMIIYFQNLLISLNQKFFDLDDITIKKTLYGYIALFKILVIIFVLGPYLALLMIE